MYLLNDDIIVDKDIIDMVLLPDGNYYGYSITLKEINPTITNILLILIMIIHILHLIQV